MRLEPDATIDRYRVEALLGEGGMAVVYRVRHVQLDTLHALKVLKLAHDDVRARLLQEGRVQAALRHPNIVSVTDVVTVGYSPGLVMEFVEGASLDQLLAQGPLSLSQIDHLARGILDGVVAAHQAGLIHRDLKPANILLHVDRRQQLVPKVTDFGLAKVLDNAPGVQATMPGVGFGTPAYMAPEQIRDAANVDHRADIFSVGAVLYELCTGNRCFPGHDVLDVLNAVAAARYEPLEQAAPDLPDHQREAIELALVVDPDERWQTIEELQRCWRGEDSAFDAGGPFHHETSQRMRVLGRGVELAGMPEADGPTALRETPAPTLSRTVPLPPPATTTIRPAPPARPRRGLWIGLAAATLLGLGLLAAGITAAGALLYAGSGTDVAAAPAPHALPTPLAAPPPAPRVDAPEPAPQPPPQPSPAPSPRPSAAAPADVMPPTSRPSATPPQPPLPEPPATGAVRVSGAFDEVWLVDGSGRRHPVGDSVAPGTYTVVASWGDAGPVKTDATFTVAAGGTVRVQCDGSFLVCGVR